MRVNNDGVSSTHGFEHNSAGFKLAHLIGDSVEAEDIADLQLRQREVANERADAPQKTEKKKKKSFFSKLKSAFNKMAKAIMKPMEMLNKLMNKVLGAILKGPLGKILNAVMQGPLGKMLNAVMKGPLGKMLNAVMKGPLGKMLNIVMKMPFGMMLGGPIGMMANVAIRGMAMLNKAMQMAGTLQTMAKGVFRAGGNAITQGLMGKAANAMQGPMGMLKTVANAAIKLPMAILTTAANAALQASMGLMRGMGHMAKMTVLAPLALLQGAMALVLQKLSQGGDSGTVGAHKNAAQRSDHL
jgi:hypothetical protein